MAKIEIPQGILDDVRQTCREKYEAACGRILANEAIGRDFAVKKYKEEAERWGKVYMELSK